ncbi:sarcosine oxidase subunit alpha family protein, partial [Rhizobiaceae sp. 2RAB30]
MAIIDVRADISTAARELATETGAELLTGHAVVATEGKALTAIKVQRFDAAKGALSGEPRSIAADLLAVSGGWSPAIHLASQAGARPVWHDGLQAFLPPKSTQKWLGAGGFNGSFSTSRAIEEGHEAGLAASGSTKRNGTLPDVGETELDHHPAPVFEIKT